MSELLTRSRKSSSVTLTAVAQRVGLSAGTVSAVLNDSRSAKSIPECTKNRILAAVREMGYRPNFFAQSLRGRRASTIGVIVEEIGDPRAALILSGIEQYLRSRNFLFLMFAHRRNREAMEEGLHLLMDRGVDGFIGVDMPPGFLPTLPSVAVATHGRLPGVTNVSVDYFQSARIGLHHLRQLGHTDIALMKGPSSVPESEQRWRAVSAAARDLCIEISPERTLQIDSVNISSHVAYACSLKRVDSAVRFTALFAYDDLSAMGAIRAFQERGLKVPHNVSVLGMDDIQGAAYHVPSLTTMRHPLAKMGAIAAQTLLHRLQHPSVEPKDIAVDAELVVRESTCARAAILQGRRTGTRHQFLDSHNSLEVLRSTPAKATCDGNSIRSRAHP